MDAARRPKMPWPWGKGLITHDTARSKRPVHLPTQVSLAEGPRWILYIQWICITVKWHWALKLTIFITSKESLLHSSRLLASNTTLGTGPDKEHSGFCNLGIPSNTQQTPGHLGMLSAPGRVLLPIHSYQI